MKPPHILKALHHCFTQVVPEKDGRSKIAPLEFVVCLVFCYLGDSKSFSLEAIRRHMITHLDVALSRSAFWERLARPRLGRLLKGVVALLMGTLASAVGVDKRLLGAVGVTGIRLLDSTAITLWDGAQKAFPGTRTWAGLKWHACIDVLTGGLTWYQVTPSRTSDRKCFPPLDTLTGVLLIFDLGYWDYGLLVELARSQVFFLSRIKAGAVLPIKAVVTGLSQGYVGASLLRISLTRKRGDILEVLIEKGTAKGTLCCRALGFWNPCEKGYHWYLTNLPVPAAVIYPLYRLRWQIELIFKACKRSLNANQIPSTEPHIIESLLLASLAAHLAAQTILGIAVEQLDEAQRRAVSFQRLAHVAVQLGSHFIAFLLHASRRNLRRLLAKIVLFAQELFDPNYHHRETSLARIYRILEEHCS